MGQLRRSLYWIFICLWVPAALQAQTYPTRPITLYYPYGPGGGDTMLRAIAAGVAERIGQPIVVEFRQGANEQVAMQAVLAAPNDGYAIAAPSTNFAVNAAVQKTPYEQKDFAPVVQITTQSTLISVNPSLPVKTLPEFFAHAKANPGKVNFGTIGNFHLMHFLNLQERAGIKLNQVPFKVPQETLTALLGGHIDAYFNGSHQIAAQLEKEGKMRNIAVTTTLRHPDFPDLPTVGETLPGFNMASWFGIVAKAGTARPIIERLNRAFSETMSKPEVAKPVASAGFLPPTTRSPEEFAEQIRTDTQIYQRLAKQAGIAIN